jgi:CheY-like chemotaxis protein
VLAADTPAAALQLAHDHRGALDLLITDIAMPGMNGRELARQINARYPGIRVLYISGYPVGVAAERGVLEPGVNFLHKPFTVSQLAVKAQAVLTTPS